MRCLLILTIVRCFSSNRIISFMPKVLQCAAKVLVVGQLCFASAAVQASVVDDSTKPVYFGVGCFWHVQHELVEAEKKVLARDGPHITSTAGYAGSLQLSPDGTVCYHNLQNKGDYGRLGYSEAVQVDLPLSEFRPFAETYFSLFKNGDRPDRGDIGPEYRSLIGIPGGVSSPMYQVLEKEAQKSNIVLKEGVGNDADTLGKKIVWVMDSEKFPFRPAELYHQFHDGFMPGEQYGKDYHDLRNIALDRGIIHHTGCPEKTLW